MSSGEFDLQLAHLSAARELSRGTSFVRNVSRISQSAFKDEDYDPVIGSQTWRLWSNIAPQFLTTAETGQIGIELMGPNSRNLRSDCIYRTAAHIHEQGKLIIMVNPDDNADLWDTAVTLGVWFAFQTDLYTRGPRVMYTKALQYANAVMAISQGKNLRHIDPSDDQVKAHMGAASFVRSFDYGTFLRTIKDHEPKKIRADLALKEEILRSSLATDSTNLAPAALLMHIAGLLQSTEKRVEIERLTRLTQMIHTYASVKNRGDFILRYLSPLLDGFDPSVHAYLNAQYHLLGIENPLDRFHPHERDSLNGVQKFFDPDSMHALPIDDAKISGEMAVIALMFYAQDHGYVSQSEDQRAVG